MEIIVLEPSNDIELALLKEFLDKTPIKNRVISEEDKEDMVLGWMMRETDDDDIVDTESFINSLKGK